jgi:hypothetical protein
MVFPLHSPALCSFGTFDIVQALRPKTPPIFRHILYGSISRERERAQWTSAGRSVLSSQEKKKRRKRA